MMTIGLIRNLRMGSISPQFHVVFDDAFTTVLSEIAELEEPPENWLDLLTFSRLKVNDNEDGAQEFANEWLSDEELEVRQRRLLQ